MGHYDVRRFTMFTKVVHGLGCLRELPVELKAAKVSRVLLIADPGLVQAGLVDKVITVLKGADYPVEVFEQVPHDANSEVIDAAAARVREGSFDCVMAMGGGSPLVVGKGAAIMATNPGSVVDYIGDDMEFKHQPVFHVAIPTAAGSGSEVSSHCPFYDNRSRKKVAIRGSMLYPKVAVLDARLMETLPPRQAALSGIDALTHALEAYLTVLATPITDALAVAAMREQLNYFPAMVWTSDLEAKQRCLVASTMANMACGNAKLGLVHDLAKPIFTLHPVPYGEAIGNLLVPVMEFNRVACEDRFAGLALAVGVGERSQTQEALADAFLDRLTRVVESIGFTGLNPDVIPLSRVPALARNAFSRKGKLDWSEADEQAPPPKGFVTSKNRRRATYEDAVRIYTRACRGRAVEE